jgi:hypothetical protein
MVRYRTMYKELVLISVTSLAAYISLDGGWVQVQSCSAFIRTDVLSQYGTFHAGAVVAVFTTPDIGLTSFSEVELR